MALRCKLTSTVARHSYLSLALFSWVLATPLCASELKPSTAHAFEDYVQKAEARMQAEVNDPDHFLQIDGLPDEQKTAVISRLRNGEVVIEPIKSNGHETPTHVPGGLVHHWLATVFIPGATAAQALQLAQDYPKYGELYKPDVQSANILTREGDHFQVRYRFYRHAIVTVVYNADFDVNYFMPDSSKNYSLTRSTRIAEVHNPGKPNESEYPVGNDHGYMWRLNLYTRALERDSGVYVQVEFVALSRTVPAVFAWIVNPYMSSIPREYLTRYLGATRTQLSHTVDNQHVAAVPAN